MNIKSHSIQPLANEFIQNKNNITFKRLIDRLEPGLMAFTYNILKDTDVCEDAISETFIKVWKKVDKYNSNYQFSTWVYAIARNECYGIIQNNKKKLSHEKLTENYSKTLKIYTPTINIDMEVVGPSGEELTKMFYNKTVEEIHNMSEPYRTVMIEREIKNNELSEIAENLNWNINTIKTRLRKGRSMLAEIVKQKHSYLYNTYYYDNEE